MATVTMYLALSSIRERVTRRWIFRLAGGQAWEKKSSGQLPTDRRGWLSTASSLVCTRCRTTPRQFSWGGLKTWTLVVLQFWGHKFKVDVFLLRASLFRVPSPNAGTLGGRLACRWVAWFCVCPRAPATQEHTLSLSHSVILLKELLSLSCFLCPCPSEGPSPPFGPIG